MGSIGKQVFDLDNAIGFLIEQTEQALKRGLRQKFKSHGYNITPYQWIILYRLWDNDGRKQAELAELTLRDRASVTRIIDVMEKHDLVRRERDRHDRRAIHVFLTQKGKELEQELPVIAAEYLDGFTTDIDQDDLQTAIKVLREISRNASNNNKE